MNCPKGKRSHPGVLAVRIAGTIVCASNGCEMGALTAGRAMLAPTGIEEKYPLRNSEGVSLCTLHDTHDYAANSEKDHGDECQSGQGRGDLHTLIGCIGKDGDDVGGGQDEQHHSSTLENHAV